MKTLLLGSSNSLMNPGYVATTLEKFAQITGRFIELNNCSVGSSTCVWGLEAAKSVDLAAYDLVLLDFAVTDPPFIKRTSIVFWDACYESLVRYLRATAPGLRIVIAYLQGRAAPNLEVDADMQLTLRRLSQVYGLEFFDVNAQLFSLIENGNIADIYSDPAHYRRPEITNLIGEALALHLANGMTITNRTKFPSNPLKYDLTEVRVLEAEDLAFMTLDPAPIVAFENSVIHRKALAIHSGVPVVLNLPGRPICFSVVSVRASGTLRIRVEEGPSFHYNTLTLPVRDTARPFLFRPLFALPAAWDGPARQQTRVEVASTLPVPPVANVVLHQPGLVPNVDEIAPIVYISSIMVR